MRIETRAVPIALALLLLSGCSLGRKTTPLQQYVLRGPADAGAPPLPGADRLAVGLRRPDLAPYAASPAIVVRRGAHEITVSEYNRWGEDPVAGISRAVAAHLAADAGIGSVDVAPWPARSLHDYLVQLHVTRFEGSQPDAAAAQPGAALLQARWEIITPDGALRARGTTDFREGGWRPGDYAGLVTLLDRGLGVLAHDVAACIGRLAAVGGSSGTGATQEERTPPVECAPVTQEARDPPA